MIYDCFTYFNEAEILEIRVNELAPLKPIPRYIRENQDRFARLIKKS